MAYSPGKKKQLSAVVIMCALPLLPVWLPVLLLRTCWRSVRSSAPTAAARAAVAPAVRPVLRDINLSVQAGELCLVVGSVGCGKTSLLHGEQTWLVVVRRHMQYPCGRVTSSWTRSAAGRDVPAEGDCSDGGADRVHRSVGFHFKCDAEGQHTLWAGAAQRSNAAHYLNWQQLWLQ